VDKRLLELLVCPLCKGPLRLVADGGATALVCRADRLSYAVRDGVPMMLPDDALVLEPGDPRLDR
jgi:uncharacterized protein YbaR (Trm112 family)